MNVVPHREIACAILLDTCGRLLLQQRDNIAGVVHPGMISLFGGHREDNETYLQCVIREIHEEIGYFVPPAAFEYLTSYEAVDEEDGGAVVHAEFFVACNLPVERLVIAEGSLLIIKLDELASLEPKLTPSTRFAIRAFLKRNNVRG
jgi:8-oxo-dGTP pyrophosphatase MutT (NUDIX family)